MALTTALLVILLGFTIWQLSSQSKGKDIPIEEWWEISGYLNNNYGNGEIGTKQAQMRLAKDNVKEEKTS